MQKKQSRNRPLGERIAESFLHIQIDIELGIYKEESVQLSEIGNSLGV